MSFVISPATGTIQRTEIWKEPKGHRGAVRLHHRYGVIIVSMSRALTACLVRNVAVLSFYHRRYIFIRAFKVRMSLCGPPKTSNAFYLPPCRDDGTPPRRMAAVGVPTAIHVSRQPLKQCVHGILTLSTKWCHAGEKKKKNTPLWHNTIYFAIHICCDLLRW